MCESRDDCVLDNTYVRILRDFDAKDTEKLQRILRDCFHHQAAQLKQTGVKPSLKSMCFGGAGQVGPWVILGGGQ